MLVLVHLHLLKKVKDPKVHEPTILLSPEKKKVREDYYNKLAEQDSADRQL